MSTRSLDALRSANPRFRPGFAAAVEAAEAHTRERLAAAATHPLPARAHHARRRLAVRLCGAVLAIAGALTAALVAGGSPPAGPGGVPDAAAAMRKAATLSAAAAERSGTAVVRITHDGAVWAQTTIVWNGEDLSVGRDAPDRPGRDYPMLVVDGVLYDHDPGVNRWIALGDPSHIDPGSGTTPAEYLAATREDVGGTTLRRITGSMSGLRTSRRAGGATVYSGTVAAGEIARETGFKEGEAIRVLPFGFVAHDEAADPASRLDAAVTVGAGGVLRRIDVRWDTWHYAVSYDRLGATPAPAAPADAQPLSELRDAARRERR